MKTAEIGLVLRLLPFPPLDKEVINGSHLLLLGRISLRA